MTWRGEALWKQPAAPGSYSRAGGELVDMGEVREFADLEDAKTWRAEIRKAHPDATVTIEDHHGRRAHPGQQGPPPPAPSAELQRIRAELANGR